MGARSVLRRYSDAWFAAAKRRRERRSAGAVPAAAAGADAAALVPRHVHARRAGGCGSRSPAAGRRCGCGWTGTCPTRRNRSARSRCCTTPGGCGWMSPPRSRSPATRPGRNRTRAGSRGWIWASSTRTRWPGRAAQGLLVSGRAIRAEHRMHLADRKARARAVARRAPKPGQKGSRRWRHYRRRQRLAEARHRRRVRQAQHEAAKTVIAWAVDRRVGTLAVGDPRGVLKLKAGRRHNQRTRDWRIGHLITVAERQGRGRRDQPAAGGRARHLLHLPRLRQPDPQACRAGAGLPGLPVHRPPRPVRGRQHRRQTRRRDHAGHPGRRHAPPRRGAPARCRPLAT